MRTLSFNASQYLITVNILTRYNRFFKININKRFSEMITRGDNFKIAIKKKF